MIAEGQAGVLPVMLPASGRTGSTVLSRGLTPAVPRGVMLHPPAPVRGLWAMTGMFPALTGCALAAFALLASESLLRDRAERSVPNPLVPPSVIACLPQSTAFPSALPSCLPVPIPTAAGSFSKPARPNRCRLPPKVPLFGRRAVAPAVLQQQ